MKKKKKPQIQSSVDEVCKETKLKSSNSYTVNVVGFRVLISNCIVVVGLLICSPKHLLRENLLLDHVGFNNELLNLSRLWECKYKQREIRNIGGGQRRAETQARRKLKYRTEKAETQGPHVAFFFTFSLCQHLIVQFNVQYLFCVFYFSYHEQLNFQLRLRMKRS